MLRSRSLWCGMLVERLMLLQVKMTLSGKRLSSRVIDWRLSVRVHNLERVNEREGVKMYNVVE